MMMTVDLGLISSGRLDDLYLGSLVTRLLFVPPGVFLDWCGRVMLKH